MSAKHTPGHLSLEEVKSDTGHIKHMCQVDAEGFSMLTLVEHNGGFFAAVYKDADARRLVACWNACEGIPTDELEGVSIEEYVIQQAFITGMNPSPEGMDLGIRGLAAQMLAASFAGQFVGNGAVNYLEVRMSHPDVGPFTVTIQRIEGLTPTQKLKQVEAQRDELLALLRIVRGKHGCGALTLPRADVERIDAAIAKAIG